MEGKDKVYASGIIHSDFAYSDPVEVPLIVMYIKRFNPEIQSVELGTYMELRTE